MKVKNEKPPIWNKLRKALNFNETLTVFTYGHVIYNPSGGVVPTDVVIHEQVHERQQEGFLGPWRWWRKFIKSPQFRYEQELEAYRVQYQWMRARLGDREKLVRYLSALAGCLSGEMYGSIVSYSEAMQLIKEIVPDRV